MTVCTDGGVWFKRHFVVIVSLLFVDDSQNEYVRP